mmetsp:Transcript_3397/g.11708  ORF Transcript_3397/g.11708 Transcript_3397/m.11708 type:complete len:969 (-) Transcript_3397:285-3191(-)
MRWSGNMSGRYNAMREEKQKAAERIVRWEKDLARKNAQPDLDKMFARQDVAAGQEVSRRRDGFAAVKLPDGSTYEGEWMEYKQHGYGKMTFPDGSQYSGFFSEGKRSGVGGFRSEAGGRSYKGEWLNGKAHGHGERHDRMKGVIYSGQWLHGKRHGCGMQLDCRTGNVLSGSWKEGMKDGTAVFVSNEMKDGLGKFIETWKDGVLLARSPYDPILHGTDLVNEASGAANLAKLKAMECERRDSSRWTGKMEEQDRQEAAAAPASCDDTEYALIPEREFRRLIHLAHSPDPQVEHMVLQVFDGAAEQPGSYEGETVFRVKQEVWDSSIRQLQHHFARKIQRHWRNNGLRRLVAACKKSYKDAVEKQNVMDGEAAAKKAARESSLVKQLNEGGATAAALFDRIARDPKKREASRLLYEARQLYSMESRVLPGMETNDYLVLSQRLVRRLQILEKDANAGRRMWDKAKLRLKFISASKPRSDNIVKKRSLMRFEDDYGAGENSAALSSYKFADGTSYNGETQAGLPHGFGAALYPDGSTFSGQFAKGKRNGLGVYSKTINSRTLKHMGEWLHDLRHGFAIEQLHLPAKPLKLFMCEYHFNTSLAKEAVLDPESTREWVRACEHVSDLANKFAFDSKRPAATGKLRLRLEPSELIEFEPAQGISVYTGELNEGLKHGVGHMRWHDGRMFAGGFAGGKMTGLGMLMEADGSVFLGRFREGDQDGYGGFFSSDGIVLIGMWRSGRRHGAGVEQEEREGQVKWKAVVQYQQDELVHLDDFSSDEVSSWIEAAERTIHDACRQASLAFPPTRQEFQGDGNGYKMFVGGHVNDQRNGYGVLMKHDGTRYVGEWMRDLPHGLGVEYYPDKSVYQGNFRRGKREGLGKYTLEDGSFYLGEWRQGRRQGRGWEHELFKMGTSAINIRDWLVEFDDDKEMSRKPKRNKQEGSWTREAEAKASKAAAIEEETIQDYEDLLDI